MKSITNRITTLGLSVLVVYTIFVSSAPTLPSPIPNPNQLKFYYFPDPNTSVEIIYNDTDSLQASGLKPATKTFIILDGFTSNRTSYMNTETKNAFSGLPDNNLILVDWGYYNGNAFEVIEPIDIILAYVTAMMSLPFAGENLAHFLHFLQMNKQIEFSDVTILSHSLGCHAAANTGKAVKNLFGASIGRIVGLDPALQFTEYETDVRLGIGAASVVEIYHTSRRLVGDIYPATGDITIYPNGGDVQPCEEEGAPGTPSCSAHSFSWKLYNYALTNTTIKACPCSGSACFCKECSFECGDKAISIGPNIPESARGSYHVKTGYLDWN